MLPLRVMARNDRTRFQSNWSVVAVALDLRRQNLCLIALRSPSGGVGQGSSGSSGHGAADIDMPALARLYFRPKQHPRARRLYKREKRDEELQGH
jgi:hypothetical protein